EWTVQATLTSGGTSWATVTLAAHVREEIVPLSISNLETLVGRSHSMTGKVALVSGASRGLGSALVRVLALHGCTVMLNFMHNQSLAGQLCDSLAHTPGKVLLEAGDIGSMEWCQQAERRI